MRADRVSAVGELFRLPQHMLSQFAQNLTSRIGFGLGSKWPGGTATEFKQPIVRLIPGDPIVAEQLYATRFGRATAQEFLKLTWLKHFAASGRTLHAIYAIDLLREWATLYLPSLHGEQATRALLALAWDGPVIARRAGGMAHTLPLDVLTEVSKRSFGFHPRTDQQRLIRGIALLSAVKVSRGLDDLRRVAHDDITRAISALILPDGGHRSRRGEELLRVMLMLMPLAKALRVAREPVPESMHQAIERMMPMLRMLVHGDGGLSHLFDTQDHAEAVAAVLAEDSVHAKTFDIAPHTGIARLQGGEAAVIADCLDTSFEFSSGAERLMSSTFQNAGRVGPHTSEITRSREGMALRHGSRDKAVRTVFVSTGGDDLRCEDHVAAGGGGGHQRCAHTADTPIGRARCFYAHQFQWPQMARQSPGSEYCFRRSETRSASACQYRCQLHQLGHQTGRRHSLNLSPCMCTNREFHRSHSLARASLLQKSDEQHALFRP